MGQAMFPEAFDLRVELGGFPGLRKKELGKKFQVTLKS